MESPSNLFGSGAGIANLALSILILQRLKAKGILPLEEITDMIDHAILLVEEMEPDSPERQSVHEILAGILSIVQGRPVPPKQP
jgi:hypothetical protein